MLLSIALAVAALTSSDAATVTVAKDGTGQFSVIQDAVNAATDGDTLLIRPGVYEEVAPYNVGPAGDWQVAIGVHQQDLTIMGVHRDSVLVRREVYSGDVFGIVMRYGAATNLRVEGLTLRNFREGAQVSGTSTFDDVRFVECYMGMTVCCSGSTTLSNSVADSCTLLGFFADPGCQDVVLRDVVFRDNMQMAFQFFGVTGGLVEDVVVEGGLNGITIVEGGDVVMRRCRVSGAQIRGVKLGYDVVAELYDCRLSAGQTALDLSSNRSLVGSGNVVRGGTSGAITDARPMELLDFRGNEILRGTGYFVSAEDPIPGNLDFSGNWWGTTEPDSVRAWILDSTVDPLIAPTVIFEPMLLEDVESESRSIGGLKGRFIRPRQGN